MQSFRSIGHLVVFILSLLFLSEVRSEPNTSANSAKTAAEFFCQIEFEGDGEVKREMIIKYSPLTLKQRTNDRDPLPPHSFLPLEDEYYVVGKSSVMSVNQTSEKAAVATVSYELLATNVKDKTGQIQLVLSKNQQSIVKLKLVYEQGQWWVTDPMPPHVSVSALVTYYGNYLKDMGVTEDSRWVKEREVLSKLRSLQ